MLGEQIVEAEEVAVVGVLADEGGVPAVVVEGDVIQPGGHLHRGVRRVEGREGEALGAAQRGEAVGAGVVTVVERGAGCGPVGHLVLGDVGGAVALLVVDDVGGVVGDDVEEDLHPHPVGLLDQRRQLGVGAQVGVDLGEVGDPVAVVAGRGAVLELDGLVLEARGQPDRGGAQVADIAQALADPGQVAAVVEALGGGVEARHQAVGGQPAEIVGGAAVLEPVRHHEVEVVSRERRPQAVAGVAASSLVSRRGRWHGQQRDSEQDGHGTAKPGPHLVLLVVRRRAPGLVQVVMVSV